MLDRFDKYFYNPIMKKIRDSEARLKTNIPLLIKEKGWTRTQFYGYMQIADLSADTAKRAWRGETNFTARNLAKIAKMFGKKSIAEIVDIDEGK